MKKLIIICLIFVFGISLTACDGGNSYDSYEVLKTNTPIVNLDYSNDPKLYYYDSSSDVNFNVNEYIYVHKEWFHINSLIVITFMGSIENDYVLNGGGIWNGNIGIDRIIRSDDKDSYITMIIKILKKIDQVDGLEYGINFADKVEIKKDYSLGEVLGFEKSEITKISYSDEDAMKEANLEETIQKLDVEYIKLESSITSGPAKKPSLGLCNFVIYKNNEEYIYGHWLVDKKVSIGYGEKWYESKEPVELFELSFTASLVNTVSWLQGLNSNDVVEIMVETGPVGVEPGSPTVINQTTDKEEITRLLNSWKDVKLKLVKDDSWSIDGGGFKCVLFKLNDGTIYSIYSNNGFYDNYNEHFEMLDFPMIAEDKVTSTIEGVVGKLGNIDFVLKNIVFNYLGALPHALETFFVDDDNVYSFPQIQSEYVIVYYENGYKENVKEALKNRRIVITDLDKFGISYDTRPIN